MPQWDLANADCIIVMGSNMAENHPVAFRWPMQAKVEHGAKLIHVDPRFTRTSAVADIYAPVRAGSDIAFLGGVIRHVINSDRWNTDPFFRSRLRGSNVEVAINLNGVVADDFAPKILSKVQSQVGFSARGGADDRKDGKH